jgi:lipopolysaccharide transport system ATP-binding protein
MTQPSLRATGLGKRYMLDATPLQHLSNALFGRSTGTPFWALQAMDLEIGMGDSLGVIGRNGSGKSTLLQLLMGTLAPSTGSVSVQGRVAGLLELGAGFNPDFTGRENAALNAANLGLSAREIARRMPAIAAFADIGAYIDRPVREYSSGMYSRLAFSVAIHVDADVLIVDEILSVGDSEFQHRCHAWMRQFRARGGTLVFVSQNALEMASICARAIWLDRGKIVAQGPSDEVAAAYQAALLGPYKAAETVTTAVGGTAADTARFVQPMRVAVGPFQTQAPQHGAGGARVVGVAWQHPGGDTVQTFDGGEEIELRITVRAETALHRPILGFILRDARGQNLFGDNSFLATAENPPRVAPGEQISAVFRFRFPYLPQGTYQLAPSILEGTQDDHVHLHWMEEAMALRVTESPVEFGLVGVPMIHATLTPCD